jgi:hypothetical protein
MSTTYCERCNSVEVMPDGYTCAKCNHIPMTMYGTITNLYAGLDDPVSVKTKPKPTVLNKFLAYLKGLICF